MCYKIWRFFELIKNKNIHVIIDLDIIIYRIRLLALKKKFNVLLYLWQTAQGNKEPTHQQPQKIHVTQNNHETIDDRSSKTTTNIKSKHLKSWISFILSYRVMIVPFPFGFFSSVTYSSDKLDNKTCNCCMLNLFVAK